MKRFVGLFTAIVIVSLSIASPYVYAYPNETFLSHQQEAAVERIITELGSLRANLISAESCGQEADTKDRTTIEQRIRELENELTAYGVEQLTYNDICDLNTKNASIRATVPDSTQNVEWYSHKTTQLYGGVSYIVQKVYAQGKSPASTLCDANVTVKLLDSQDALLNGEPTLAEELITIYAQKSIGLVKLWGLFPYELLFSGEEYYNADIACSLTYSYATTVCFCFVYPKAQGETYERLAYVSSQVEFAGTAACAGMRDGSPYSESTQYTLTTNATNYASSLVAAEWYANMGVNTLYSFVNNIPIYYEEEDLLFTVPLPTPMYIFEIA